MASLETVLRRSCFYRPILSLVFFIVFVIKSLQGSLVVSLKAEPSNVVNVGDPVDLICTFQGKFDRGFSVTWRHGVKGVYGEECRAFIEGYEISCWPGMYATANNFKFHIKKAAWSDRGKWHCALNFNGSNIELKVMSPAPLISLKPLPRANGRPMEGTGTRTNPYNLLSPNLTQFECSTGCGYPLPNIKWTFSNRTSSGSLNQFVSGSKVTQCLGEKQKGMTSSRSVFSVKNCTEMGLFGHLQVTCSLTGSHYRQDESRSFFIVCPGSSTSQPYGGVPALMLTHGEVIGIAVGCAMALILTFLSILWFHRKRLKAQRHSSV